MNMLRRLYEWFQYHQPTLSRYKSAEPTETSSSPTGGLIVNVPVDDLNEVYFVTLIMAEDGNWDMATNCERDEIAAALSGMLFQMAREDGMVWGEGQ